MPKRRVVSQGENAERTAPAVVLQFPVGPKRNEGSAAATLPPAPAASERPALLTPKVREWLRITLIVSLAIHIFAFLAFQLRFHDDLERAAGAAAALSSQGTITIPVEVVEQAMLPPALTPTNATPEEAKTVDVDQLMPTPPDPAPVVMPKELTKIELPAPPEPAPLALPAAEEAPKLALPQEEIAPAKPVETAPVPQAPSIAKTEQVPVQEKREQKKTVRSAPSVAAAPSRAAAGNTQGDSGSGGSADAGGSAAISSYQAQVLAHLNRHRVYPPEARERGITGVARVQFALGRDGRVLSASLIGGSGERSIDSAALDMVRRASPFPPFPAGVSQPRMDFAAPIRFDLR